MVARDYSDKLDTPSAQQRVAALAARQHGVVSVRQLTAAGLDTNAIHYRAATGWLHHLHRGVYAVGHVGLSPLGGLLAAVLALGDGAVLSHGSAAWLWGLLWRERSAPPGLPDVLTARHSARRRNIRVHTTRYLPVHDVTVRNAVPVTTPARTLVDLAASTPEMWLSRALAEATRWELAEVATLVRPNRPGARRLRALVDAAAPTESVLEDDLLRLLRRDGFPPAVVNQPLRIGGATYRPDVRFARTNLILEADGDRWHRTREDRRRDSDRQAAMEAAGFIVLRLTYDQITGRPEETARRISLALRTAARA